MLCGEAVLGVEPELAGTGASDETIGVLPSLVQGEGGGSSIMRIKSWVMRLRNHHRHLKSYLKHSKTITSYVDGHLISSHMVHVPSNTLIASLI